MNLIKPLFVLTLLFIFQVKAADPSRANPVTQDEIDQFVAGIYHELVTFRRDLYKHPELAGEERRTAKKVTDYLSNLGLTVHTQVGGHGVVATIQGGKPGKHIAWRADMDATLDYHGHMTASGEGQPAVKHVYGHDIHTTIALGIAKTLVHHQAQLAGSVSFIFQPAEETQAGAKAMIKDQLFTLIQPDEIYAAHVGPMQVGAVATMAGNQFTHARSIRMAFSAAEDVSDLTEVVNQWLQKLTRKPADQRFDDFSHLVDPEVGLGNPATIYSDYVIFEPRLQQKQVDGGVVYQTQLYTTDKNELDQIFERLKQQIAESKFHNKLKSLTFDDHREGVNNDAQLVNATLGVLEQRIGTQLVQRSYGQIPYSSEDFGHFQKKVPGVYFLLGAANEKLGHQAYPHMTGFTPDETSIYKGVSYFSSMIMARLFSE